MAKNRAVNVVIKGDYDNSDIQRAIRELNKLGGAVEDQGHKMSTIGKAGALALAGGVALAAKEVFDFTKASIDAAQESVVADARLGQVAKSMGLVKGAYAGGIQRLNEYSSALQKQIGVDDESIKLVQSKLLTFRAVGETMNQAGGSMDRATKAAYDLAAAGFGTAEANATQLGKALQDPVKGLTALARSGVTFTAAEKEKIKALVESGKAAEAQDMVLKAIEKQVGGTAAATATGAQKMKVAFGELQEKVGTALLPVMNKIADVLAPMFDQLQGPLSQVAEVVGGALSKAFDAIAPVLPTLATAFAQIAGVIGGTLATVLQNLIPVITPILQTFADLATRIAPLLQPVLEKIGDLLGKVLTAVSPLLEPLADLVFTILEAAMPIFDIVAEALDTIIAALAPLFPVIADIIPPLGELVKVLFKAIEPILRPLLPLIESLAALFSDILARAIGIIIMALGGLIVAGAKMASFILDKVTKPVIEGFLTFAETIVGAAASAFGWVPGLGDKLNGAKKAIGDFKTNATKAIGDAATAIGEEGTRIGQGLIDNGVALVNDPSSVAKARKAGQGVGDALSSGMAVGITNGQIPIQAAATKAIDSAERAARRAAQSNSPSLLFAAVGRDLADGLAQGVKDGGDKVRASLQEAFGKWFEESVNKLKERLADARQAFSDFKKSVADAITGSVDLSGAQSGAADRAAAIADAQKKVDEAAKAAMDEKATDSDKRALVDAQSELAFAQQQGTALGTTFMDALRAQANQAREFAGKIKTLISMDLSLPALQQVLTAGATAGGAIADQLIAGGSTAITETNQLVTDTQAAADEVGQLAAVNWYGAGVASAKQTLDGFREQFGKDGKGRERINAIMDSLAESAKRTVRLTVDVVQQVTQVVTRATAGIVPPDLPQGATGGIVNVPTVALIGEAGPEAVVPLNRTPGNNPLGEMSGGGNTYNITVQAGVGDPAAIGRTVVESIRAYERRSGKVFAAA